MSDVPRTPSNPSGTGLGGGDGSPFQTSEALLRNILSHAPLVLYALDPEGVFTLSTGKGLEALGLAEGEAVGRSLFEMYADFPEVLDVNRRALDGTPAHEWIRVGSLEYDLRIEPAFDADGHVIGATGIAIDITERRDLEAQLRQSQKMDAIGQMAGGIAHDFNNLLTAIAGHCDLLRESLRDRPELLTHPEEIARSVDLAASLTQRLLAFGRRDIVRPEIFDLNNAVGGMEMLIDRATPDNVTVAVIPSPTACWVHAGRVQVEQSVMNLVLNARDAVPGGGRIEISCRHEHEPPPTSVSRLQPAPGPYVVLSVSDTGPGIEPGTEDKIFDPFFTTKGASSSGLGLSTVYGIVAQCRGTIELHSRTGVGTTIRLYLPRAAPPGTARAHAPDPEIQVPDGARALVVEDNTMVRQLTVRVLQRIGFSVEDAESAEAARELLIQESADPFDLLVSDVVLPGESGTGFAKYLSQQQPDVRILFMSGYPLAPESKEEIARPGVSFLQKPFTPRELVSVVRDTIRSD